MTVKKIIKNEENLLHSTKIYSWNISHESVNIFVNK